MIPVDRAHLPVAAITHPGMRRRENEDRYAVSAYRISRDDPTPSLLAVIADGVGGHRAGEVAAELAVEVVSQVMAAGDAGHPLSTLQEAFLQANQAIYAHSMSDPDLQGMSTTCVCAWVIGDRLFISSVGDSRIYLERGSKIHRLTTDHTWVQEALDSGALTPEQARNHPNAHVIRRHLGSQAPVVADLRLRLSQSETDAQAEANQGMPLLPGDNLLLCSDGLTDLVADGEILDALAKGDLQEAVQELVNLANARGGHDNLTLIGIQGPGRKTAAPGKRRGGRRSSLFWVIFGLAILLLAGGAFFGAYYWFSGRAAQTSTPTPTTAPLVLPTLIPTHAPLLLPLATQAEPAVNTRTPVRPAVQPQDEREDEREDEQTTFSPTPSASPRLIQATYTPWPTATQ